MSQLNTDVQSFPSLPADLKDAAALVQRQLKESLASLDARMVAIEKEYGKRKIVAIALKVISVLSSLVVLSGVANEGLVQVLGGAITGIAALERIFANMSRLLALSAAKAAYERARMQVVAQHNRKIIEVVKFRDRDPEKSANALIAFVGELRDRLADVKEKVETDLGINAYENLGRLTLEDPKTAE